MALRSVNTSLHGTGGIVQRVNYNCQHIKDCEEVWTIITLITLHIENIKNNI